MSPYTMPTAPTTAARLNLDRLTAGPAPGVSLLALCSASFAIALRGALVSGHHLALLARALGRPQHRAAALGRAAPARVDLIEVGRVATLAADLVVVGELFARYDVAHGLDEHAPLLDDGFEVRIARMLDEECIVPIDAGIDHRALDDDEQERVIVVLVVVLVTTIGVTVRDALAEVLDDAGSLGDDAQRERAETVYARLPHLEQRRCRFGFSAHTATAALMAG